jgi:hypothetical protein
MKPRIWEDERRQRGSTEAGKAVTDTDHGIADRAIFRAIAAAATSKEARAGSRSVNTVDCPGGRGGAAPEGGKDDQDVGVGRL